MTIDWGDPLTADRMEKMKEETHHLLMRSTRSLSLIPKACWSASLTFSIHVVQVSEKDIKKEEEGCHSACSERVKTHTDIKPSYLPLYIRGEDIWHKFATEHHIRRWTSSSIPLLWKIDWPPPLSMDWLWEHLASLLLNWWTRLLLPHLDCLDQPLG